MVKLKIDIDSKKADFKDRLVAVKQMIETYTNVKFGKFEVYETNKGFHVIVDVEGIENVFEIVLLQLLLGSDWKRECLNYIRAKKLKSIERFEKFNILFTAKYKVDTEKDTLRRFFSKIPTSREKVRIDLERELNNGLINFLKMMNGKQYEHIRKISEALGITETTVRNMAEKHGFTVVRGFVIRKDYYESLVEKARNLNVKNYISLGEKLNIPLPIARGIFEDLLLERWMHG